MPKVVREGKIVDMEPVELSDGMKNELKNPGTAKLLTTTDKDGVPHCVCKHSMVLMEDGHKGCLAFMEMIEGSQTSKNLIWNYDLNRPVAITTFNPENQSSFQVKGVLYKYIVEGPIWQQFLKQTWEMIPMAEPAGVWVIIPTEERDEGFMSRMKEEDTRLQPPHHQWFQYRDASYARRYGLDKK